MADRGREGRQAARTYAPSGLLAAAAWLPPAANRAAPEPARALALARGPRTYGLRPAADAVVCRGRQPPLQNVRQRLAHEVRVSERGPKRAQGLGAAVPQLGCRELLRARSRRCEDGLLLKTLLTHS